MAPLVLIGTIITHLFGGSAGREGTAVQMGGAIADQFTKVFKLDNSERKH
jgi:H+/Cl- antiporter ClcA